MISRTPTLAEWPYRMVLACDHCPRVGQYRKETLIAGAVATRLCPTFGTSSRNARARIGLPPKRRARARWQAYSVARGRARTFALDNESPYQGLVEELIRADKSSRLVNAFVSTSQC
jgi:hypothetical protein